MAGKIVTVLAEEISQKTSLGPGTIQHPERMLRVRIT